MNLNDGILLECLQAGLNGNEYRNDREISVDSWKQIIDKAYEQEVLPLIYETVYRHSSFRKVSRDDRNIWRDRALQVATRQIVQTNELLTLILKAQKEGLNPIILKGICVRSLYPFPYLRPSVDEDLLIGSVDVEKYHSFFISEGLIPDDEITLSSAGEISYHKPNSPTYIELHTEFFPRESAAYGNCNRIFTGAEERSVEIQIQDVSLRTLAPTDHLLYLICHAYKHFLHSGVGIRQVCDIGMFTKAYERDLDWKRIFAYCESIRLETFTAAIYQILNKYLGFDMPDAFSGIEVDETDLLEDILSDGTYGTEDPNRVRSSTITLEAVAADRAKRKRRGILHSVFLPRKNLVGRYPYLRKYPFLLPLAWGSRIKTYAVQRFSMKVDPSESIRIGRERIAILRKYRVID